MRQSDLYAGCRKKRGVCKAVERAFLRCANEQFPRRHFYVPFGEFVHLHIQISTAAFISFTYFSTSGIHFFRTLPQFLQSQILRWLRLIRMPFFCLFRGGDTKSDGSRDIIYFFHHFYHFCNIRFNLTSNAGYTK